MEHLDNDMDDLFQKAGELYPLKTTGSEWDAVAGKLQDENFRDLNAVPGFTKRARSKRKWLLLLLLIPLGLAGLMYTSGLINHEHNSITSVPVKRNPAIEPIKINTKPVAGNKKTGSDPENPAVVDKSSVREGLLNKNPRDESENKVSGTGDHRNAKISTVSNTQFYATQAKHQTKKDIAVSQSTGVNQDKNDLKPKDENKGLEEEMANKNETTTTKNNTSTIENSKTTSSDISSIKKKSGVDSKPSKGIYTGFEVGPDVSTVAFQSVKNLGFSLGVTVGYRFNKRLAIETGFMWDKKYYYSDGAHFKNQSTGYTILNVNGNCNMFEIPIALRYDFASVKNNNFFAKAGLSSYLMREQNYSYTGETNGMQYTWTAKPDYTAMNYIFSSIQLSGGYEFSISGKTKIQVEPYVKIPLQGIGVGKMLISSTGIYFGITHSFR